MGNATINMKRSECYSQLYVPENSFIVLRMDGRAFSKLTRKLQFKGYNLNMCRCMGDVSKQLMQHFNASLFYSVKCGL